MHCMSKQDRKNHKANILHKRGYDGKIILCKECHEKAVQKSRPPTGRSIFPPLHKINIENSRL